MCQSMKLKYLVLSALTAFSVSTTVSADNYAVFVTGAQKSNSQTLYTLLRDEVENCMYVAGVNGLSVRVETKSCLLEGGHTSENKVFLQGKIKGYPIKPGDSIVLRNVRG